MLKAVCFDIVSNRLGESGPESLEQKKKRLFSTGLSDRLVVTGCGGDEDEVLRRWSCPPSMRYYTVSPLDYRRKFGWAEDEDIRIFTHRNVDR